MGKNIILDEKLKTPKIFKKNIDTAPAHDIENDLIDILTKHKFIEKGTLIQSLDIKCRAGQSGTIDLIFHRFEEDGEN